MFRPPIPLLLATLLLSPIAAAAQNSPPAPQKSVYLDVETVDIHLVAAVLERYNNVKISTVNGNMPYRLVSVHLVNAPIRAAIETIATSAGAKITQDVAGIYVFTPAPTIVAETTTFVPPTHFIGAAGNPFAGTTFGDPAPGNYSDASSGLLGFGMTKPSDIFRSMSPLDFLHWQSRIRKTGTISKPNPSIEARPLLDGVVRIFDL